MTSDCPISSGYSPAKFAARGAPMFDRISTGKKRPDARRFPSRPGYYDAEGLPFFTRVEDYS
jgi:hypothetical protein